ncbi:type I secretion system permease/ATPase [Microbulbifer sp. VAAF005]|uniref:type I secretion system permease/ATPase n=1 Tax=Microbulbifer sp. VAAF005 TaxID=3034230 RepID=UPI0024ADB7C0|nr:type I secretion system permease/ATPase [Microbulbifer sp. VAAF005]WHI46152.1 type I secretion system permease/ATPase [Microbulbifer sp. VAAF005]
MSESQIENSDGGKSSSVNSENTSADFAPWCEAIISIARHYRIDCSSERVRIAGNWGGCTSTESVVRQMARQAGLSVKFCPFSESVINSWRMPLVAQMVDGQLVVIDSVAKENQLSVIYCGDQGLKSTVPLDELRNSILSLAVFRPRRTATDSRVDDYVKAGDQHWFRRIVLRDLKPYFHVMIATTIANSLALAGIVFSKQVYDRVIPAESFPTLYVLFSGVVVAIIFDFIMRTMRVRVTDLLGKRADIRMSDLVFGHAIRVKDQARPKSTGTFISQIRDLERIRELFTSSTVLALADLPFFILFLFVMWWVAGSLALIPLVAVFMLIIPGLLLQPKLAKLSKESIKEGALRNAMLIETVQGLEDIKAMQAEQRFQGQWNHFNAITAESSLKLRYIVGVLLSWTHNVQSSVFAVVVLFGAPMVMAGDMTTGALVAASILGSRMMSPMANITQVLSRWQQARFAMKGIDQIMQLPVDNPEDEKKVQKSAIQGNYHFKQAVYYYGDESSEPALVIPELKIQQGERVAILGRNGSGKSTLLHALSGYIEPTRGQLRLDDVSLTHIDPADVRRDVSLLSQKTGLFHGTIYENLVLGAPYASDEEIIFALEMSGAKSFVSKLSKGLGCMIQEGGYGLSGGQKQSLLLARILLRQPNVLLLDEPTSALDEATEKQFIQALSEWSAERTVVIATHRTSILSFAERILVLDSGRVALDEPKEKALSILSRPKGAKKGEKVS